MRARVDQNFYTRMLDARRLDNPFLEHYKLKTFSKFRVFREMLLFSECEETNNGAIESALNFFCDRFPTFVIAFFTGKRLCMKSLRDDVALPRALNFGSSEAALSWLRARLEEQVCDRFDAKEEYGESCYEEFYESQFIESRRNLKQMRQSLPKIFRKEGSIEERMMRKHRFTKPNTSLSDFTPQK